MRIIGGEHRGRKLSPLTGKNIRPTTDRLRETIFNILNHSSISFPGANILDVFAGTGALGLEALSRGATHATFFDRDRESLQIIKKNIALLGLTDRTAVKQTTAPLLPPANMRYNFIFLDPPYGLDMINDTMTQLREKNYLASEFIIIVEYAANNALEFSDDFTVKKEKTCGNTRITFIENSF